MNDDGRLQRFLFHCQEQHPYSHAGNYRLYEALKRQLNTQFPDLTEREYDRAIDVFRAIARI